MVLQKTQVVAAVIERSGKFLLGKRSLHKASAPGFWCAITGKIEPGETQRAAVAREVMEETGLIVEAIRKQCEVGTRDGSAVIHWWRVALHADAQAQLCGDEHSELRWVTLTEMRQLQPVFPEDLAIFASVAPELSAEAPARLSARPEMGSGQPELPTGNQDCVPADFDSLQALLAAVDPSVER
jgi:8-oxo-dGTP diphosphatase